jgi:hypothetical protein
MNDLDKKKMKTLIKIMHKMTRINIKNMIIIMMKL